MRKAIILAALLASSTAWADVSETSMTAFVYPALLTDHNNVTEQVIIYGLHGGESTITPLTSPNIVSATTSPLRIGDVFSVYDPSAATLTTSQTEFKVRAYTLRTPGGPNSSDPRILDIPGIVATQRQLGWPIVVITKTPLVGGSPNMVSNLSTEDATGLIMSQYFTVP